FRGCQSARLTPPSPDKPITLFGGLNGAGKTTLLEALQLALYGRHAPFLGSPRGYDTYLTKSIHRQTNPEKGASVGLAFRVNEEGHERAYQVERSWRRVNGQVVEDVTVSVDGRHDTLLSDNWFEHAERFIPARLAPLFFFDGERIEAMADSSRSAEVLETAIHALLGVDLVDRLKVDLNVLAQRKQKEIKSRADRERIEALERELESHGDRLAELKQQCGHLQNERDRAEKRLRQQETRFAAQGGRLGDERKAMEQRQNEAHGELGAVRSQLVQMAAGPLPLVLVADLLQDAQTQAELESRSERAASLVEIAAERDAKLIAHLKQTGAEARTIQTANRFLRGERRTLAAQSQCDRFLELTANDTYLIRELLETQLGQDRKEISDLVRRVAALQLTIDELDRALASVPDEEALADLLGGLRSARNEFSRRERELISLEQAVKQTAAVRDGVQDELGRLLQAGRQSDFENSDVERHLRHSERVDSALGRFRVALVAKHTTRLQDLIRDGYLQLLRKRSLISRVEIDPESCALYLFNGNGQRIPEDRLSAGERQLLAVAMLWGLAKASGRPLPTVIDTPLGRLDSTHRKHLVERYFPHASHQVILLSTDEEIDEGYFEQLRARIGHVYRLEYDDRSGSSAIVEGYFW
ncbi:MAG: DNA sulfur modification protein DndD, partial [Planctomycetes bacterium]|nr:DNA sulfur modification protein DndD [Planctomycetota bacterium]